MTFASENAKNVLKIMWKNKLLFRHVNELNVVSCM